jgi:FAD/FMN-containing dehydrogenase
MNTEDLAESTTGGLVKPGDEDYDEARSVWNARFDRRPDLIARCRSADDVRAAVDLARTRNLRLAVKGGGHSFAAQSVMDGGLLVDLSPMKGVAVDPDGKTARVQPGVTWGEFDPVAQEHGLATPGGTVSTVGVAGFTLGGGIGYLCRKHGMAIDNLLCVDVVTAHGELVRASADENSDLFWAIRGGGGNFGIATSFEFRLHEVGPTVLAGQIMHRFEDAPQLLRFYREFMASAPEEMQCYAFFLRVPPIDPFPKELHGQVALDFVVFHTDPGPAGEAAIQPLLDLGDPFLSAVEPQPYTSAQRAFDDGLPAGHRYESRAHDLHAISDGVIETLVDQLPLMVGDFTVVYLAAGGGAGARVEPAATAFPHRDAAFSYHIMAGWSDPAQDEEVTRWVEHFHESMTPHSTGGVYVNVLGTDEEARVRAAYGANYARLTELKKKWDPENLFRSNSNIEPTG